MMPHITLDNVLLAVAGIGTTFTALRLGAYKALKEDLSVYQGRVETLEKEIGWLKKERAADQVELQRLRERTDMSPILEVLQKQTTLLAKLCTQHEEHSDILKTITDNQSALATTFGEVLAPRVVESVLKENKQ